MTKLTVPFKSWLFQWILPIQDEPVTGLTKDWYRTLHHARLITGPAGRPYSLWTDDHAEFVKTLDVTIRRTMWALVGYCVFCFITLSQSEYLRYGAIGVIGNDGKTIVRDLGQGIKIPVANVEVASTSFGIFGPIVLVAIFSYLHASIGRLGSYHTRPNFTKEPTILNHGDPFSRLVTVSAVFIAPLATLAYFTIKSTTGIEIQVAGTLLVLTSECSLLIIIRRVPHHFRKLLIPTIVISIFFGCLLLPFTYSGIGQALENLNSLNKPQLNNAVFSNTDMQFRTFRNFKMRRAQFQSTDLFLSHFEDTDLSDANFEGSNLESVSFKNTDLAGARFKNANIKGTNFELDCRKYASGENSIQNKTAIEYSNIVCLNLVRSIWGPSLLNHAAIQEENPFDEEPREQELVDAVSSVNKFCEQLSMAKNPLEARGVIVDHCRNKVWPPARSEEK